MKDKRINNVVKMIIINSSLSYKSILNCIDMETVRRESDTALEDSYDTELQMPANKASCGVGSATLQAPESSAVIKRRAQRPCYQQITNRIYAYP